MRPEAPPIMIKLRNAGARFQIFSICADAEASAGFQAGQAYLADSEFAGEFHSYFSRGRRPQFSQRIRDAAGLIAIIDFDQDPEDAVSTAAVLEQMFPGRIAAIALSNSEDSDLLLRAMRAGCCEFLPRSFDPVQYSETIARVVARFAALSPETVENRGSILSFFGVKGGVGVTTLAVYLATFLVRQHSKKTLLIDHHHQLGHVCLYLGIKENPYYFGELMKNVDRLDAELLAGFLTRHPSGLDLLASPDMCAAPMTGTPQEMETVLEFLRSQYDYVLIDSSLEYQDVSSAILSCSDEIYLISTPDVAALRDLSRRVENFGLDESAAQKLRIVLNRSSSHDAVSARQVEATVRFPVFASIPNNYFGLVRAINAGEPISPEHRSEFTAQIGKWAHQVVEARSPSTTKVRKRRSFAFWK